MRIRMLFLTCMCFLLISGCGGQKQEPQSEAPLQSVSIEREEPPSSSQMESEEPENVEPESVSESTDVPPPETDSVDDKAPGDIMNEYGYGNIGNSRFNFWLTVPQDWATVESPEDDANGGRITLVCENPKINIRAYGEDVTIPEDEYNALLLADGGEMSPFEFVNDNTGIRILAEGRYVLYTYNAYDRNITFYVGFERDPDWYEQNRDYIEKIAKTLRDDV